MTRVPVPDDYERGHVSVAGRKDYHYGEADVNLDTVDRARDVTVSEDEDGRYVGVNAAYADAVAEYLGVGVGGTDRSEDEDVTYTCAGKDGECTREVDEEGGLCWQHEDD